jgi:hypothetical protein
MSSRSHAPIRRIGRIRERRDIAPLLTGVPGGNGNINPDRIGIKEGVGPRHRSDVGGIDPPHHVRGTLIDERLDAGGIGRPIKPRKIIDRDGDAVASPPLRRGAVDADNLSGLEGASRRRHIRLRPHIDNLKLIRVARNIAIPGCQQRTRHAHLQPLRGNEHRRDGVGRNDGRGKCRRRRQSRPLQKRAPRKFHAGLLSLVRHDTTSRVVCLYPEPRSAGAMIHRPQ